MKKKTVFSITCASVITGCLLIFYTQDTKIERDATNIEKAVETNEEIQKVKYPSQFTAEEIQKMPLIESISTVISYELNDMPETADLIVLAEAVKPYEAREHVANYGETPEDKIQPIFFAGGYTKTEVIIKKIIKPSVKNDVMVGDEITIIEPLTIFQQPDDSYARYATENYVALDGTSTYLLFLVQPDPASNTYGIQNFNEGRFSINDSNEFEKALVEAGIDKRLKSLSSEETTTMEEMLEKHNLFKDYLFNHFEKELKNN